MFFSSFALPLTNPTKKGVFLLPIFKKKGLPKRVIYSIPVLILNQALLRRVFFFYFCPHFNQSLTKKDVLLYFCPHPNQCPAKKGCVSLICPYFNKSPTKMGVFSIFALTLTKALPQRVFSLFWPLF